MVACPTNNDHRGPEKGVLSNLNRWVRIDMWPKASRGSRKRKAEPAATQRNSDHRRRPHHAAHVRSLSHSIEQSDDVASIPKYSMYSG